MANLTQPSLKGSKIPTGHVILNAKFHGSAISKVLLESGLVPFFDDTLGLIDCYASDTCAVLFVREACLVNTTELQLKICKLQKFPHTKVLLVEKTEVCIEYFKELQYDMLASDAQIIPYVYLKDIATLISQLANYVNKDGLHEHLFKSKKKTHRECEDALTAFLLTIPEIGDKKARELLTSFKSISNIATATEMELSDVVGCSASRSIMRAIGGIT